MQIQNAVYANECWKGVWKLTNAGNDEDDNEGIGHWKDTARVDSFQVSNWLENVKVTASTKARTSTNTQTQAHDFSEL